VPWSCASEELNPLEAQLVSAHDQVKISYPNISASASNAELKLGHRLPRRDQRRVCLRCCRAVIGGGKNCDEFRRLAGWSKTPTRRRFDVLLVFSTDHHGRIVLFGCSRQRLRNIPACGRLALGSQAAILIDALVEPANAAAREPAEQYETAAAVKTARARVQMA
jgi:hypothetical protein